MLSELLLTRLEINALFSVLSLASDRPLVFPANGSGAPRQRPIPGAQLQLWLRVVLRMTSFQIIWALVFFVLWVLFFRGPLGAGTALRERPLFKSFQFLFQHTN